MGEEVSYNQSADRRKCAVQDIQPADEVIVEPESRDDSDNTRDDNHRALTDRMTERSGNVGKTERTGIQTVVVCGPDVGTQNENSGEHESHSRHDVEDVVFSGEGACNTAEEEHQRVADKERDNRGPDSGFQLGETCEVRGGCTA